MKIFHILHSEAAFGWGGQEIRIFQECQLLLERGHKVQFFVLTGESGQAELKSYCEKLGIQDRSVIIGPVPHEEVKPFFDLIDMFDKRKK